MKNTAFLCALLLWACDDDGGEGSRPDIDAAAPAPDVTVDAAPDVTVDAAPDMTVDAAPDVTVDAAPDVTVDATPDVTVDAAPDVTVDAAPDVGVDAAPDAGPCVDDPLEENDDRDQAAPLAPGALEGLAICAEDEDWFVLDACAGEPVRVDARFVHAAGDLDLRLFDHAGEQLANADSVDDDETLEVEAAEIDRRFFLRVIGYEGAENTYALTAAYAACPLPECVPDPFEGNDAPETAPMLEPGARPGLTLCGPDDWYAVELCAGQTLNVAIRFEHARGDLDMRTYDFRGTRRWRSTSTSDDEQIRMPIAEDGTYYVRVYGFRDAVNTYALEIDVEGECRACGDGELQPGEACDGEVFAEDCAARGFDAGEMRCRDDCSVDASACRAAVCGDGRVEGVEVCDGPPAVDCAGLGFAGGALGCVACRHDATGCEGGHRLSGTVSFERPRAVCNPYTDDAPCADDDCCLRPDAPARRPAAHVEVRLVDAEGTEQARSATDADGRYSFAWAGPAEVRVEVLARAADAPVEVIDNTQEGALHAARSPFPPAPPIDAREVDTHDVSLSANWTPDGFEPEAARPAAPFSILAVAQRAARTFRAARPDIVFAPLRINWSTANDTCRGDKPNGCIGTSHWDGEQLFILGMAEVDTDEFDTHVVAHEWGHYFDNTQSRSDSPGGGHSSGQVKDARLAFAEGHASALAAVVFHPEFLYVDTRGEGAAAGFFQDMEANDDDDNPGWFSEVTVRTLLYDLFDPATAEEPFDGVELGVGGFYDALVAHGSTPALTTVFSYLNAARGLGDPLAVDDLVGELYAAPPCELEAPLSCGLDLVADDWGSAETHHGGWPPNLPGAVYPTLEVDGPGRELLFRHGGDVDEGPTNWLDQNRYLRFAGTGGAVAVTSACPDDRDVDVYVYRRGERVGETFRYYEARGQGDERVVVSTELGASYSVNARGRHDGDLEPYACMLALEAVEEKPEGPVRIAAELGVATARIELRFGAATRARVRIYGVGGLQARAGFEGTWRRGERVERVVPFSAPTDRVSRLVVHVEGAGGSRVRSFRVVPPGVSPRPAPRGLRGRVGQRPAVFWSPTGRSGSR